MNLLSKLKLAPRHRTEGFFLAGLLGMILLGGAWLATHLDAENLGALKRWLKVFAGDTSEKLRTEAYVKGGLMAGALSWIGLGIFLILTRRWWCFESSTPEPAESSRPLGRDWRLIAGLGLITLMALAIRWPRMDLGFYNDEADVFRSSIEGEFDRKAFFDLESEELPKFKPTRWMETLWGNRLGNNHALHSLLARLSYDRWQDALDSPHGTPHEWPARLPALLGGLVSIAAAGALATVLTGRARAGLFAAFFLAIHPWHVRYSTEARGYALLFAFGLLTALFLVLALRENRWRLWLGFAVCQFGCFWSNLGSLYLVFGLDVIALALILWKYSSVRLRSKPTPISMRGDLYGPVPPKRWNPFRSERFQGFVVANLISAALVLAVLAPNLAGLRYAMGVSPTFQQGAVFGFWPNIGSFLLVGIPWYPGSAVNPNASSYLGNPLFVVGLAAAAGMTASGWWILCRRHGPGGILVVVGPLIALVLPYAVSVLTGATLLIWYVSFVTVFIPVWMAVGLNRWIYGSEDSAKEPGESRIAWQRLATYGLLGLYAVTVMKPLAICRNYGKEAARDAIELARGDSWPFENPEEALKPLVVGWWTNANIYDPYLRIVHRPELLELVVNKARSENRPLYFVLGLRPSAAAETRDGVPVGEIILDRLEKSGEFETVEIFPSLDGFQYRTYLYRLKTVEPPGKSGPEAAEKSLAFGLLSEGIYW